MTTIQRIRAWFAARRRRRILNGFRAVNTILGVPLAKVMMDEEIQGAIGYLMELAVEEGCAHKAMRIIETGEQLEREAG